MVRDGDPLSHFLACPILFDEPDRVVSPPSWIEHIPFAFWIVAALRPRVFVELGTHSGNSYAAFAQAVQRLGLPAAGYAVDTWRGDPHAGFYDETVFTEWSAYHESRFSGFSRLVRSTFAEAAEYFPDGGIDLLHLDGYHTFEAITADFELWRPKMSDRGVVLVHDINVRERDFGAWWFWERAAAQYRSFAFLHGHGLGVLGVGSDLPDAVSWLLSPTRAHHAELATIRALFARLGTAVAFRYAEQNLRAEAGELGARPTVAEAEAAHVLLQEKNAELESALERIEQLEAAHDQASREVIQLRREAQAQRLQLLQDREVLEQFAHNAREVDWLRIRLASVATDASAAVAGAKARAREQVARLEASNSWRLTAPLRAAARTARLVSPSGIREARKSAGLHLVFDSSYYLERYPEVAGRGLDPLADYLRTGWREHRNPHPIFDTAFYLQCYPDVAASGLNPLVHYMTVGAYEGRDPHPLFQSRYYLDQNPDVAAAGLNPLAHFVRFGGVEGRNPHPSFDSSFYLARYTDVAMALINPLVHFVTFGAAEQRDPNAHFVTAFYVQENPDAAAPASNPLVHYLQVGQPNGRRCRPPAPSSGRHA